MIELMTVVGIMILLAGLLLAALPGYSKQGESEPGGAIDGRVGDRAEQLPN